MDGYGPATYGDGFADVYDDWYQSLGDPDAIASLVSRLAADGVTVELGVGTGRVALVMAARGIRTLGLDASAAMLRRLSRRVKERESLVPAIRADMAVLPFADNRVAVVLAVYNTLFNITDRGGLEHCFAEVARVLCHDGAFVVETFVPSDDRAVRSGVEVRDIGIDRVVLTASRLDPANQTIVGQHIEIDSSGVRLRPWLLHYAYPSELDEIADSVGLRLESRWSGWQREPFDASADMHVSVYRSRG